jgi:hypothetical protein
VTTPLRSVCWVEILLTDAELAELAAIPQPANELETQLWCELEAEHPGPHLTLGQASGDIEWWLRWGLGGRDLVVLVPCSAEGDDHVCTLPLGHPGGHSFELEPGGGRTPSLDNQRVLEELFRRHGTEHGDPAESAPTS